MKKKKPVLLSWHQVDVLESCFWVFEREWTASVSNVGVTKGLFSMWKSRSRVHSSYQEKIFILIEPHLGRNIRSNQSNNFILGYEVVYVSRLIL